MKTLRQHINTLNLREAFEEFKRGVALPPGVLKWLRQMQHRQERLARYAYRNASYPYCGKRHLDRIGA